jgi:hypothetical protein
VSGVEDPAVEPEGEEDVGAGQVPDSIDVQPEDPDYPGRDSPEPID